MHAETAVIRLLLAAIIRNFDEETQKNVTACLERQRTHWEDGFDRDQFNLENLWVDRAIMCIRNPSILDFA
jgi:hypothetical protein